jgi:adenosine deaminase
VRGRDHPLSAYLRYDVPAALATDDQGVSRSDMTHEYLRAVETHDLSYLDLKRLARQSLEHSFLPGASLWAQTEPFRKVSACATREMARPSPGCARFLDANERARMQWRLESDFAEFEKKF